MNEALEFFNSNITSPAHIKRENLEVKNEFKNNSNKIVTVKYTTLVGIFNEFYVKKLNETCLDRNWSISIESFCELYQLDGSVCFDINKFTFSNLCSYGVAKFLNSSNIVSKKVFNNNLPISMPISIDFSNYKEKGYKNFCIFYNKTTKLWSNKGCSYVSKEAITECQCNHTTIFALLLLADTGNSEQIHAGNISKECLTKLLVS